MASITYTALREIEPTGYSKTGTDISAAAADDSFNSASTSLLGLNDNEWVLVAGFVNAANNGWFQANGASTASKIAQDTTTNLVTEAAGPSISLVGYKRGYGQAYSIDFGVEVANRSSKVKRTSHQPIGGGLPEMIVYRSEAEIQVTTGIVDETNLKQWREFLASVEGGETFTFDRYGTAASPIEAKTAILESESYSEAREGTLYPGRYRIGFTVRLLD
jgi:hypothetical protein